MSDLTFRLGGALMQARPSGALYWPDRRLLAVGDLHLGRSERLARRGAPLVPPYETEATLERLEQEALATDARMVACLGDSFDDLAAADALAVQLAPRIARLCYGRRWIWVAGNHDPGPVGVPGTHVAELVLGGVRLRHMAGTLGPGEVELSAHYHPKARLRLGGVNVSRPCFLVDERRAILPAFGTYTGGLDVADEAFREVIGPAARALVLGRRVTQIRLAGAAA